MKSKSQLRQRLKEFVDRTFIESSDFNMPKKVVFNNNKLNVDFVDDEMENKDINGMVNITDANNISRSQYRSVASKNKNLPRSYKVDNKKKEINADMQDILPIQEIYINGK